MAAYSSLGQGLGDLMHNIVNGHAIKQAAYNAQLRQNMQAALMRGKLGDMFQTDQAWQAMPGDLNQITGGTNGQALTDVTRATGSKDNQLGDLMRRIAQSNYLKGAVDASRSGNTEEQNVLLSAGGAKPVAETRISGNTAYDPNVRPAAQKLQITPYVSQNLGDKFVASTQKPGAAPKFIPLNGSYLKAFYVAKPIMDQGVQIGSTNSFDHDKFNDFTMWATDRGQHDLNQAYPQWLETVRSANADLAVTLQHAQVALKHGAPLEAVQRRLMELQVNPEVIARLQQ